MNGNYAGQAASAPQVSVSTGLINKIEHELVELGNLAEELHRLTNRICGPRPESTPPPGDPVNSLNGPMPPLVSQIAATGKVLERRRMEIGADVKRLQEFI